MLNGDPERDASKDNDREEERGRGRERERDEVTLRRRLVTIPVTSYPSVNTITKQAG